MENDVSQRDPQHRQASTAALVFILAIVLGAFVVVWSVYDTRLRGRELAALMESSGAALAEALGHAVEDSQRSSLEIEELASNRLLDQARLCDRLDRVHALSTGELDELAAVMGLDALVILDRSMRPERTTTGATELLRWPADDYVAGLRSLSDGEADYVLFGPRPLAEGHGTRFAVAIRRSAGGQLLAAMDVSEMLAFQEEIGPDHLMTAVGQTGGILDAWLEDEGGEVVAGARGETPADVERLEFARPVLIGDGEPGTLRLGLSGEVLTTARRAGARRTIILGTVLFGLALALSTATVARQRARVLRGETARVQATTDAVLTGMADAVVLLDRQSVIRLVNPAASRLFDKPAAELVGRACRETSCADLMEAVSRPGSTSEVMIEPEGADPIPALVSVSDVEVPTIGVIGTAVVLRDLRELKALEAHTRRTENLSALGTLAAAIAHEVRNPLNSISVGVQRLDGEFAPAESGDDYRRLTGLLRREVERLDAIVNRFLDFARTPKLDLGEYDLDALVRDVMPLLQQSAPASVRLRFDPGEVGRVVLDPVAMRQVLLNLVRNAIEAVGETGSVTIRTRPDDRNVRLEVEDDGPGVPPDDRERVFRYGFTTKPSGTGMGLAIVQRMIAEMNGSVDLEAAPAGGSLAVIRLPAAPARTGGVSS